MLKIDPFAVWSCCFLTTREASRAIVRDGSREQAASIGSGENNLRASAIVSHALQSRVTLLDRI